MEIIIAATLCLLVAEVSFLVYMTTRRTPIIGGRKVYIDTSALMDGRIVTAARTGFIPDKLVVPSSVVAELQLLADQADNEKRTRARRGLDAITELQEINGISVTILNDGPVGDGGVDARLVELAKKEPESFLCTIDFNLNKVATVNGVTVLNINELAGSIRMAFLPGETMSLALTQKGQGDNQAVGYLADGTMVVVDKAGKEIGKTVQIEFIRSLQTAAGRMMFARLVAKQQPAQTRGEGKAGGRMIAKTAQARSTSKGGSRALDQDNAQSDTTQSSAKTNSRKSANTQSASATSSKKASKRRTSKSTASSREDSLLELVNNQ